MKPKNYPWDIPDAILLLGTDASGKDYVANVLTDLIREAGGEVEKRQRFFGGKTISAASSEDKGFFDTLQEKTFLLLFQRLGFLMPLLVSLIIFWDSRRFRLPVEKKLVVVGHNALRALAFHLGHRFDSAEQIRLPWYLIRALNTMKRATHAHIIVLDVDDHIRKKRIAARLSEGSEDTFDRYMHSDSERSERIEACLVQLVLKYLDGRLLENNDLPDDTLKEMMHDAFPQV
jgi:hypothetical protein